MDPRGGIDPPRPLSPATAMNSVHTVDDLRPQPTTAKPRPLAPSLPNETGTILPQPSPRYPGQGNSAKPQRPPTADSPSDTEALTEYSPYTNSETAPSTASPSVRREEGQVVVPQPSDSRSILDPQEYSIDTQATVGDSSRARDSAGIEHMSSRGFSSWKPDRTQQFDFGDRLATYFIGPSSTQIQDAQDPLVTWLRRLGSTLLEYTKDPLTTGPENPEFPQGGTVSSPRATGYTKPDSPAVAIQGQTITNNAAPITIGGAKVAYHSGTLSVDDKIQPVPFTTNKRAMRTNLVVVDDLSFSILPAAAQADVTHAFEDASGTTHVDENNNPPAKHPAWLKYTPHVDTNNVPPGKHTDSLEYVTVGSQTLTLQSNAIQVAGKTLKRGDPAITVDGTPISLGYSEFVFGTRTEVFSLPTMSAISDTVVDLDDTIVTPKGGSLVVAGNTMTIGEPAATINGIPISLGSSELIIGSQTSSFAFPINTMGTNDSGNLDELIIPGLDRIGGGVVGTPSTLETGTVGTGNAKDSTPYLGQTVKLCVPVRIYLVWATGFLVVFLVWS